MAKIMETKTWTEEKTRRDGTKYTEVLTQKYNGDLTTIDLSIMLHDIYPDFSIGTNKYDLEACKEYIFGKLLETLENNKDAIKAKMRITDGYFCGFNDLECACKFDPTLD